MGYQRTTLSELLGELVVYRSLTPQDERLPGLAELGLRPGYLPRKAEAPYAQVVLRILQAAQELRTRAPLQRLLYIGDTVRNDALTIASLGKHLPIRGFIAAEAADETERVEIQGGVMFANRWEAVADFTDWLNKERYPLDEGTALLLDLDKTAFGARGRNSQVIDSARVAAVRRTVEEALGEAFDELAFRAVYDELNQQKYHHFTADNQDYLAYICLMVLGGVYPRARLFAELETGQLTDFSQFLSACEERGIPKALLDLHREVYAGFRQGDPTPFKAFRRREYQETVARMDSLPDEAAEEVILAEEIVLTREVIELCRYLKGRRVLIFGLTDKPDEASLPPPELQARGWPPLHRARMKLLGTPLGL